MKLPEFHDSSIIGICIRGKDLIINLKLDEGPLINQKLKKQLFTFYLEDCKKSNYWYKYIMKYCVDGIKYYGHCWPTDINDIKLKRKELTIYLHHLDSRSMMGIYGKEESRELPIPPQMKVKRVVRIQFESLKTT